MQNVLITKLYLLTLTDKELLQTFFGWLSVVCTFSNDREMRMEAEAQGRLVGFSVDTTDVTISRPSPSQVRERILHLSTTGVESILDLAYNAYELLYDMRFSDERPPMEPQFSRTYLPEHLPFNVDEVGTYASAQLVRENQDTL